MLTTFISAIAQERGRYPVANMVGAYLRNHESTKFLLGDWLRALELSTLEDIQTKLDMFLHDEGPDHAAEDLIAAVDLMSSAEIGELTALTDKQIHERLFTWYESNMLEKLHRVGMVQLKETASLSRTRSVPPQFAPGVLEMLEQATVSNRIHSSAPTKGTPQ